MQATLLSTYYKKCVNKFKNQDSYKNRFYRAEKSYGKLSFSESRN